jgi:hypothetical protein
MGKIGSFAFVTSPQTPPWDLTAVEHLKAENEVVAQEILLIECDVNKNFGMIYILFKTVNCQHRAVSLNLAARLSECSGLSPVWSAEGQGIDAAPMGWLPDQQKLRSAARSAPPDEIREAFRDSPDGSIASTAVQSENSGTA